MLEIQLTTKNINKMLKIETLLTINNSQDICEATKHATKLYLESSEFANKNSLKEDLWSIRQSFLQEQLNIEIKRFFNINFDDVTSLKSTMLAAKTTPGMDIKPVFAKAIHNRYFEKNTNNFNEEGIFVTQGINIPEKASKSIQNISKLLDENADLETIRTRLNRVAHIIREARSNLNLTSVDLDIIEILLIQLFGGNHSQAFFLFVEQMNNIENLSSVVFSSITLKICAKLSPLLAAKFLMHFNTDSRMLDFFKEISNKIMFQSFFLGKSRLFLKMHTRKITYGFMKVKLGLGFYFFIFFCIFCFIFS